MEIVFIDTNIVIEYLKNNEEVLVSLNGYDKIYNGCLDSLNSYYI